MFSSIFMSLNIILTLIYDLKITCITLLTLILLSKRLKSKPSREVYLVDYACYKPKKSQQISREEAIKRTLSQLHLTTFTEKTIELLRKLTMAVGLGDSTYAPETLLKDPPDQSMEGARSEVQASIYGAMDVLLATTGVKVEDIGVLVVNCSVFTPAPSLTSMIVNRYKLRNDVKTFNISGMGCGSSLISIDLANQLLQVNPNTYAMVVSTEVIGQNYYIGNDPLKLAINCVMRVGGAAILLSNKPSDRHTSKYQLKHTVRINSSSSDHSYGCVFHEEDERGIVGVTVTKDLIVEARNTIKKNLVTLATLILPMSEKIIFISNYLIRKLKLANIKPYTANFRRAIDHFILHAGGKTVIDVLEKSIKIDAESARMTLYRYGNTSSSLVWYELAYVEAKGKMKKGDRVCQMAFGSGFECNSVVWNALRNVDEKEKHNPWSNEIDNFPVKLENFAPLPIRMDQ